MFNINYSQWNARYNETSNEAVNIAEKINSVGPTLDAMAKSNIILQLNRFSNNINTLKVDYQKLKETLNETEANNLVALLQTISEKDRQLRNQLDQKSESAQLFQPKSKENIFDDYSRYSSNELRQKQRLALEQQDKGIDHLLGAVRNQKAIAQDIGSELINQNKIIDEINDHVEGTDVRIGRQNNLAQDIVTKSGNCWYYVIIILIIIIIVIVAAVPKS